MIKTGQVARRIWPGRRPRAALALPATCKSPLSSSHRTPSPSLPASLVRRTSNLRRRPTPASWPAGASCSRTRPGGGSAAASGCSIEETAPWARFESSKTSCGRRSSDQNRRRRRSRPWSQPRHGAAASSAGRSHRDGRTSSDASSPSTRPWPPTSEAL